MRTVLHEKAEKTRLYCILDCIKGMQRTHAFFPAMDEDVLIDGICDSLQDIGYGKSLHFL